MNYILFTIVISVLIYSVKYKPGIYLVYILLFQSFNQTIFQEIGLEALRYSTTILLFPLFLFFHVNKINLKANIKPFLKNEIAIGYFILTAYIIIYGLYIGTSYEINYIKNFLMPGFLLFMISGLFIFDEKLFKQFLYGVLIFTTLIYLYMVFVVGFDLGMERRMFSEYYSMSTIWLPRIAGLAALYFLFLIIYRKGITRYLSTVLLIISIYILTYIGTRGPLVALVFALLLYFIISREKLTKISYLVAIGIIVGFLMVSIGFSESLLFERMFLLTEPEGIQSMARYQRYILFSELLPNYYLLGLGPGGWGKYFKINDYPHNIAMEFVIEFGIVGAISFLLITLKGFSIVTAITRNRYSSYYSKAIALGWFYIFINTMFSGDLLSGSQLFLIYSALLIGLSYTIKLDNGKNMSIKLP